MEHTKKQGSLAGFLVPSLMGIFLFMIPVQYDGSLPPPSPP